MVVGGVVLLHAQRISLPEPRIEPKIFGMEVHNVLPAELCWRQNEIHVNDLKMKTTTIIIK